MEFDYYKVTKDKSAFCNISSKNKCFSSQMAVAGAEKLKPEIQKGFKEKFELDIQEEYGVTEASLIK